MPARLTIVGSPGGGVEAANAVKAALGEVRTAANAANATILEGSKAAVDAQRALVESTRVLQETTVQGGRAVVEQQLAQIRGLREQEVVARQVAASYAKGSEAQAIAIRRVNDLIRQQTAILGEQAAVATTASRRVGIFGVGGRFSGSTAAEDAGAARGFASRATGVGGWLAGPGFIAGAVGGMFASGAYKAVQQEQEQTALLAKTVRDLGISWERTRGQINDAIKAETDQSGFTRRDLVPGFMQLLRVTGDVAKSERDITLAANIARGAHISFAQAVNFVAQAENGRFRGLERLVGQTQKVTTYEDELKNAHIRVTDANRAEVTQLQEHARAMDKAATSQEVLRRAQEKFAGDAKTYMGTAEGATARLRVAWEDLQVAAGKVLLPAIRDVASALVDVIHAMSGTGTTAVALKASLAAIGVTAALVFGGPAGIAAVSIAAGVELMAHWKQVEKFFKALWVSLRDGFNIVWDEIKIMAVGALAAILKAADDAFGWIPGLGPKIHAAREAIDSEMMALQADMRKNGQQIGDAWGAAFETEVVKYVKDAQGKMHAVVQVTPSQGGYGPKGPGTGLSVRGPSVGARPGTGGFVPAGAYYVPGRSDQGRDFVTTPGGAIIAPGDGYCVKVGNDPKGFGPDYPVVYFSTGRYAGDTIYIGHCHSALRPGETFKEGQVIAHTGMTGGVGNATVPGWAEIGYASSSGVPGKFGQATPFGKGAGSDPFATSAPPTTTTSTPSSAGFTSGVAAAKAAGRKSTAEKGRSHYTPLYGQRCVNYIATRSAAMGLDPEAVLAVASVEGGFNGAVGDFGTSFGPFQLHVGGELPAHIAKQGPLVARAWANSTEGLDYALKLIQQVAGGETGAAAVSSIVTGFEKPARPGPEIAKATGRLGTIPFGFYSGATGGAVSAQDSITAAIRKANATLAADIAAINKSIAATPGMTPQLAAQLQIGPAIQRHIDVAEQHLRQLRAKLSHPLTGAEAASVRAQIKFWESQLSAALKEAGAHVSAAAAIASAHVSAAESYVETVLQRQFDAQTKLYEQAFNRETQAYVAAFNKATEQAVRSMQVRVRTQYGSFLFGGAIAQTPAERMLAEMQAQDAQAQMADQLKTAQQGLAQARLTGDPVAIAQAQKAVDDAQRQQREYDLQQQAQVERTAADKTLSDAQQRYQDERQAQLDAYQQQRQDQLDAYEQLRQDQWAQFQLFLADQKTLFEQGVEQWADYVRALAAGLAAVGVVIPDAVISQLIAAGTPPGGYAQAAAKDASGNRNLFGGSGGRTSTGAYGRVPQQMAGFNVRPTNVLLGEHEPEAVIPWSWMPEGIQDYVARMFRQRGVPGASMIPRGRRRGAALAYFSGFDLGSGTSSSTPVADAIASLPGFFGSGSNLEQRASDPVAAATASRVASQIASQAAPAAASAAATAAAAAVAGQGAPQATFNVNITVLGSAVKESDLALAVRDSLIRWARSNGVRIFGRYA